MKQLVSTVSDGTRQSIKDFFAKPVRWRSGNFSTTDAGQVDTWSVLAPLYSTNMYLRKLDGVFAFKGTAVYTIMINATRFDQGRYILAWVPTGGGSYAMTAGTGPSDPWRTMKLYSLKTVTQLPRVDIDVNKDTQVVLRVPYVSHTLAWPVRNYLTGGVGPTYGDPGFVSLYTYDAIVPTSGTTAGYDIFVHFEDVELFANGLQTQMGDITVSESFGNGPISSVAKSVSNTASNAKKLTGAVFDTVSWVANYIAGAASYVGFSKPNIMASPDYRTLGYYQGLFNADCALANSVVAHSVENHVDQHPGYFGTSIDEMSIDFIKSIYCYDEKLTWTTSDAVGAVLYDELVDPSSYYQQITDSAGINSNVVVAPITGLTTMFAYYRGGVTYKFKFVKTEFHSGRLLVLIAPYDASANATTTFNSTSESYLSRTVIDTRTCNEFEIAVPFISVTPWKKTSSTWRGSVNTDGTPFARIKIVVLNPLKAPSTVSSTVKVMVEVKGSEDFELACPNPCVICPIAPTTLSTQMGDIEVSGNFDTGTIGNTKINQSPIENESSCIGEKISNLRAMCRRFGFYTRNSTPANVRSGLFPFIASAMTNNGTATPSTFTMGTPRDYYNLFSFMYALRRGGVRIAILDEVPSEAPVIGVLTNGIQGNITTPATHSTFATSWSSLFRVYSNSCASLLKNTWGMVVTIPQYFGTQTLSGYSNYLVSTYTKPVGEHGTSTARFDVFHQVETTTQFLRAGADDCTFGVWCGFPPLAREDYD
jgi:hypothetical protein